IFSFLSIKGNTVAETANVMTLTRATVACLLSLAVVSLMVLPCATAQCALHRTNPLATLFQPDLSMQMPPVTATESEQTSLTPGKVVHREFAEGRVDSYIMHLEPSQYIRV